MKNRRNSPISEIMTTRVHTLQEHEPLSKACCLMAENHLRHVPVLPGKTLVGLISHCCILSSIVCFYNDFDEYEVTEKDRQHYSEFVGTLDDVEKSIRAGRYIQTQE